MFRGLTADEDSDDEYCRKLYEEYLNDTDPEKEEEYSLEECKKEWGLAWCIRLSSKRKQKKFIDKLPIAERKENCNSDRKSPLWWRYQKIAGIRKRTSSKSWNLSNYLYSRSRKIDCNCNWCRKSGTDIQKIINSITLNAVSFTWGISLLKKKFLFYYQ